MTSREFNTLLLKRFPEIKEDFENYRIVVHALKSSSLTIGATKVSEAAKALEMACKESNLGFVKQNHATFVGKYTALLAALKNS